MLIKSESKHSFMSGFFLLEMFVRFLLVVSCQSFALIAIVFHGTTIYLPIYVFILLVMDVWVISTFGLLTIVLLIDI